MASADLEQKQYSKRTAKQNRALHVLFQLLANELNESGLDMRKTLKPDVQIPWSKITVKEFLWKPVMRAQLQKVSTTQMTTKEIDEVFETINRYLGEHHGAHVPFPSIEDIIFEQEAVRKAKAEKRKNDKTNKK